MEDTILSVKMTTKMGAGIQAQPYSDDAHHNWVEFPLPFRGGGQGERVSG